MEGMRVKNNKKTQKNIFNFKFYYLLKLKDVFYKRNKI